MADDFITDAAAVGDGVTFASKDDGGVHSQRTLMRVISAGVATDVSTTIPVPVDLRTLNFAGNLPTSIEAVTVDIPVINGATPLTMVNAGTFAVQESGAALTALNKIDDIVHAGPTVPLNSHVPMSGQFDDVSTTPVTENQVAPVRITSGRALHVATQGSVTVVNSGTFPVQISTALPTGANTIGALAAADGVDIGNVDVATLPSNTYVAEDGALGLGVLLQGDDGTNRKNVNVDATTGDMQIDVTNTVTVAGTVTADAGVGPWPATDNGGSLTVDWNNVAPPIGAGVEATALRVTIATDTTGLLSVDDGGSSLTVDAVALDTRALVHTTDRISASLESSSLMNGTTVLVPKFAVIDAATLGNNTLVAAVSAKKIRVLSSFFIASGTVSIRFEDGADGTALSGRMDLIASSGGSPSFSPVGQFETTANTLLNLELSAAVQVSGWLIYVEV